MPHLFTSALDCSLVNQKRSQGYCSEVVDQTRKFAFGIVLIFKFVPPALLFSLPHFTYPANDVLIFRIQYHYLI